jgi:hypothetical protein
VLRVVHREPCAPPPQAAEPGTADASAP